MSEKIKAFVEYIYAKERPSKKGDGTYTSYNVKLQDPDTGKVHDTWYQFGFKQPANKAGRVMEVGDYIQVQAEKNRDAMRVVDGSLMIHPNPPARPANPDAEEVGNGKSSATGTSGSSTGRGGAKSTPVKDSELFGQIGGYLTEDDVARITRATALEAATRVVLALLDHKSLKVSEAQGPQGVTKRYEQVMTAIDKQAVKYYYDLATGRQLEAHEDEGTVPTQQTEAVPLPDAEPSVEPDDFPDDIPGDDFE